MRWFLFPVLFFSSTLSWGQAINEPIDYVGRPAAGEFLEEEPVIQEGPIQDTGDNLAPVLPPLNPLVSDPDMDESVIFGVGINGVDEKHLNALDRSSLMDYGNFGSSDREESIVESLLMWDEAAVDRFDRLPEPNLDGYETPDGGAEVDLIDDKRPINREAF